MDNANGQYAYHRANEHGNAILHGSFDQERHGTGNGSAQYPLQTTPNETTAAAAARERAAAAAAAARERAPDPVAAPQPRATAG